MYIVDHLDPGTTVHRQIEVQNASTQAQHIELYPAAASVDGGDFTAAEGRDANDLSAWTTLEDTSLDLDPGEIVRVGLDITVPKAAPEGERYAAVLAEVAAPDPGQRTVQQINRVGIRMYISVGPGGEPPSDFTIGDITVQATGPAGWPVLTVEVTNTGQRALDITGEATLQRARGTMNAGPFATSTPLTLLPGQSSEAPIELDEPLPAGAWKTAVTLSSGELERSAEATVTLPEPPASAAGDGGLRTSALILGVAVAAVLVGLWFAARYMRSRR